MELDSGHKWEPLSDKENEDIQKDFRGYVDGLALLEPGRWFFTAPFIKYANKYYNFKFKPTDVIVMTFPKCGTTWTQEITWTMLKNKDLNNPLASLPVNNRVPFLEMDFITDTKASPPLSSRPSIMKAFNMMCPGKNPDDGMFLQLAEAAPEPRIIKTHLPFSLLSKDMLDICKVIFVARNPKDSCVSFHHHHRILKSHDYVGTFDKFVDYFLDDKVLFAPYWEMLKEGLDREGHPNLHLCYYEDLKNNTKSEYQKLNQFLKTDLSDQEVDKIVEYTSFKVMKEREQSNMMPEEEGQESFFNFDIVNEAGGFFRKGEAGDWKNKLTPEQVERFDEWTAKNVKLINKKVKYYSE